MVTKAFVDGGQRITSVATKKFTPIGERVVLQVIEIPETTQGGLILPEQSRETWTTPIAQVIAVGPNVKQLKEGDKVLVYAETIARKVRYDNDSLLVVFEGDVVGVIDK